MRLVVSFKIIVKCPCVSVQGLMSRSKVKVECLVHSGRYQDLGLASATKAKHYYPHWPQGLSWSKE